MVVASCASVPDLMQLLGHASAPAEYPLDLAQDREVLPSRDHQHAHCAVSQRDVAVDWRRRVRGWVEAEAHIAERATHRVSDEGTVLADAGREHQRVQPT